MNPDILQAIATGLVTILGFFMFYDSKKRTDVPSEKESCIEKTENGIAGNLFIKT